MRCHIVQREDVTSGDANTPVQRLLLNVEGAFDFVAGQYLLVQDPSNPNSSGIPLSIASAPDRLPQLELHYRSTPGLPDAITMDALIESGGFEISGPHGAVTAGPDDHALLLIAAGTGIAQAFACAEARRAVQQATTVLWCAERQRDFYGQQSFASFGATLVAIADDRRTPTNEGMMWLRQHASEYRDATVIIAGAPPFVHTVTDLLLSEGFTLASLHSDVYAFDPPGV